MAPVNVPNYQQILLLVMQIFERGASKAGRFRVVAGLLREFVRVSERLFPSQGFSGLFVSATVNMSVCQWLRLASYGEITAEAATS